jgi:hypothetical protein
MMVHFSPVHFTPFLFLLRSNLWAKNPSPGLQLSLVWRLNLVPIFSKSTRLRFPNAPHFGLSAFHHLSEFSAKAAFQGAQRSLV